MPDLLIVYYRGKISSLRLNSELSQSELIDFNPASCYTITQVHNKMCM